MFDQGLNRIFDEMPDICIDVPGAYNVLEKMGDKMYQLGVLSEAMYKDLPARFDGAFQAKKKRKEMQT